MTDKLIRLAPFAGTLAEARKLLRGLSIIGLHGPAHCGKDTVASYMAPVGMKRMAFADPLKEALRVIFGLSDPQLYDPAFKDVVIERLGVSPRQLMTTVGTGLFRNQIDDDIWLRSMAWRMIEARCRSEVEVGFVVTDVRYENEAALIRALGGTVVHIVNPRVSRETQDGVDRSHCSEAGIAIQTDDMRLENDAGLDKLRDCAEALVSFERGRLDREFAA